MLRSLVFASVFVAALVAATPVADEGRKEQPEVLLGLTTSRDAGTLTLTVASKGCTAKADFRLAVDKGALTVFRTRRDECKAMPERLELVFKLAEIGLKPASTFTVTNRFAVSEDLAGL